MTLRSVLQTGLALLAIATIASIQWSPARSQAADTAKAAAATPAAGAAAPARPAGAATEPPGATGATGSPVPPTEPASGEPGEEGDGAGAGRALTAAPADPAERARWLTRELDAAVAAHPGLATAKLGAQAYDLATGAALWQHQSDLPMSLASTTKLFTSSAALRALGPGFVWRTALYGEAGTGAAVGPDGALETLYLRGRGDPTLELAGLRTLAVDLADLGIRRITKQLVIDATYFDDVTEPPHFDEQPKEHAAFRAPVAALSVSRNAVTVVVSVRPDRAEPLVRLDPPVDDYFKILADELVVTPDGKTRIRIDVTAKKNRVELKLTGQLSAQGPPFYRRVRIDDPTAFATAALRMALAEQGIRTPTRVVSGPVPSKARLLVAFDSPRLGEVVRRMNKLSDNFVAEALYKTLGAEQRASPGPATWNDGAAAIHTYLGTLALPGALRVENGSGLFDASSVSAAQLVGVLRASHRDFRFAPDFLASLPVGGVDGTLQSRFGERVARGLVRAKTGTLAAVSTLAGYVGTDSAHLIAFAVLLNDLAPTQRGEARALQEDLVDVLALYLGASPLPPAPAPTATR